MQAQGGTDGPRREVFRAACLKEFELVLEESGKLLRKRLALFFPSNLQADRMAFRDLFRYASQHGLLDTGAAERWLQYRDHCDDAENKYGKVFTAATTKILPVFIADARALVDGIESAMANAAAPRATGELHLANGLREQLLSLCRAHLPGVEVWAYGSRANGRSHDGSDLDLLLRGPGLAKIPRNRLRGFREAVRESTLPIRVEALDWAHLPERFHHEVEQNYVVLVPGPSTGTTTSP